jgi:hypothetical protein
MNRTYTLAEANQILPLVRAVAREFHERRALRQALRKERDVLEHAATPEGLRLELSELDARIAEQDEGLFHCRREFEAMGMKILQSNPLTLHIRGQGHTGEVVFCWEEGESSVCYGHECGHEQDGRRPLRLKSA